MEHQFSPLLHLMKVLKADAELSLLAEQQSDSTKPLPGMLWSVSAEQPETSLSDVEIAMLQQSKLKLADTFINPNNPFENLTDEEIKQLFA